MAVRKLCPTRVSALVELSGGVWRRRAPGVVRMAGAMFTRTLATATLAALLGEGVGVCERVCDAAALELPLPEGLREGEGDAEEEMLALAGRLGGVLCDALVLPLTAALLLGDDEEEGETAEGDGEELTDTERNELAEALAEPVEEGATLLDGETLASAHDDRYVPSLEMLYLNSVIFCQAEAKAVNHSV